MPSSFFQKKGQQLPIHRSRSVPALTKYGNTSVGGMFRVVPTTPRLAGSIAKTSMKSPPDDTGNFLFHVCIIKFY